MNNNYVNESIAIEITKDDNGCLPTLASILSDIVDMQNKGYIMDWYLGKGNDESMVISFKKIDM